MHAIELKKKKRYFKHILQENTSVIKILKLTSASICWPKPCEVHIIIWQCLIKISSYFWNLIIQLTKLFKNFNSQCRNINFYGTIKWLQMVTDVCGRRCLTSPEEGSGWMRRPWRWLESAAARLARAHTPSLTFCVHCSLLCLWQLYLLAPNSPS